MDGAAPVKVRAAKQYSLRVLFADAHENPTLARRATSAQRLCRALHLYRARTFRRGLGLLAWWYGYD